MLLAALSAGLLWPSRTRPYLGAGWLWFLFALLPVSGLVQVGTQAYADRYTYVPLVGIFIAVVWSVAGIVIASGARSTGCGTGRGGLRGGGPPSTGLLGGTAKSCSAVRAP